MTFLIMNLACFLLKIGSAPNFRPSFHFFNWQTAAFGFIISALAMYFVVRMNPDPLPIPLSNVTPASC